MNKIFIPIICTFRLLAHSMHSTTMASLDSESKGNFKVPAGRPAAHILPKIEGTRGKENEMVFCCASASTQHVLYFPGDVQDYAELMEQDSHTRKWSKWNLEDTAILLSKRFPNSYIWVIRPARKFAGGFNCFDNFVEGDTIGTPVYSKNLTAISHLKALLYNAVKYVNQELQTTDGDFAKRYSRFMNQKKEDDLECEEKSSAPVVDAQLPVVIAGFSKGCIVMNQMLHELQNARQDEGAAEFLQQWKALYWLDGGHSGTKDTWITDVDVLRDLTDLQIDIQVHMTPYQSRNPQKPWTGKEAKIFMDTLQGLGAKIIFKNHFEERGPSLKYHFGILEMF
ncbi:mitochondrial protein C2orf69 homolog [Ptychodera flava]|uniref:mitochondrial protein C2orf69 homolog n=1 Tax=Ptychodera flava TaxID=63121 RepID=UPI00396AA18C